MSQPFGQRTPTPRNTALCLRCGMPCVHPVYYRRLQDAVDALCTGTYCSEMCLFDRFRDAKKLVNDKRYKRRGVGGG